MNRIAVFAHFDANNEIKNYVIHYLKELNKIADKIIFVSDCCLKDEELSKIDKYIIHSISFSHGEYDFGSYKRGYLYAKENNLLEECDELIFANDSCYGPLYPFSQILNKYFTRADFWGININNKEQPLHIQSFFIVFKSCIFNSACFAEFMKSIQKEQSKQDIINKYEIGLSQMLLKNGFHPASLFQTSINMTYKSSFLYQIFLNPFIKISTFKGLSKSFVFITCKFIFIRHKINYPIKFIIENIALNLPQLEDLKKTLKFTNMSFSKKFIPDTSIESVIPFNIYNKD